MQNWLAKSVQNSKIEEAREEDEIASSSMEDTERGAHHDKLSSPNVSEDPGSLQKDKPDPSNSPKPKEPVPAEAQFLKKKVPEHLDSFNSGNEEAQAAMRKSQNEPKSRNSQVQQSKPKIMQQLKIVTSFKPGTLSPPRIIGNRSKSIANMDKLYPQKTERRVSEVYPNFERHPSRLSIQESHLHESLRSSVANFVFRGRKASGYETPTMNFSQRNSEIKTQKTPQLKAEKSKKVPKKSSDNKLETANRNLALENATFQQLNNKNSTFNKIITRTQQVADTKEMQKNLNYRSNPQLITQVGRSEKSLQRADSFLSESDFIEEELKIVRPATPIFDATNQIPDKGFADTSNQDRTLVDQTSDRFLNLQPRR